MPWINPGRRACSKGRGKGESAATKQLKDAVHRAEAKNLEVGACLVGDEVGEMARHQ